MSTFSRPSTAAIILALSGALTVAAMPAKAAENSFSFPPQAGTVQNGAISGAAINLPATGTPDFSISFVLPQDYAKNEKFSVVLYMTSGDSPCITRIVTQQLNRFRRGAPVAFDLAGLDDGSPIVKIGADLVAQKVIFIEPGDQLNGQRPGDGIRLQFRRQGEDPTDTCDAAVFIQAIDIRYPI